MFTSNKHAEQGAHGEPANKPRGNTYNPTPQGVPVEVLTFGHMYPAGHARHAEMDEAENVGLYLPMGQPCHPPAHTAPAQHHNSTLVALRNRPGRKKGAQVDGTVERDQPFDPTSQLGSSTQGCRDGSMRSALQVSHSCARRHRHTQQQCRGPPLSFWSGKGGGGSPALKA
jgi:hypothetical protein